jgi:metal-responsive CopG/Arc/MetJ family transcriptional regulator
MPVRKTDMRFNIQDDKDFVIDVVDAHVEEYNDIKSRSDFYKQAAREFIRSRKNKGKFKRIS